MLFHGVPFPLLDIYFNLVIVSHFNITKFSREGDAEFLF